MEEESGDPLPPSVGDPAGGSMEKESRDPSPLCHREEEMPPCVSSPSAQLWCDSCECAPCLLLDQRFFTEDLSLHSQQWFPHLIPIEIDDEEKMMSMSFTLWNYFDGQSTFVQTTMAGIAMSNHAAAEAVAGAAAMSPLRPMSLDLDFNATSNKESSGPSPMGDEVAPMAPQPLPTCTSPSTMEHILHPEASRSLAEASDATSVEMAEQGNALADVLHTVRVRQSKERLLLRIQSLLLQKNEGQLHVLLNFLENWSTLPKCVEDYYAQAQQPGASGSLVPRSDAQAQHSGSKPYPRRRMHFIRKVRTATDSNVLARCFQSCSETGGTSHLRKHVLSRHKNYWDLQSSSRPPKTPQKIEIVENPISLSIKKESENENEHIELGNNNMEVQPGDMLRNRTDDMEVEPGDLPREPIVDMDVDLASMLDAAIGIKESRHNEDKAKVAGTQLMGSKRPPDINSSMNDHPRSGENGGDNELNEVDQKDVKVETGDASRKRKKCASESESEAWLHFTKVLDGSGVVIEGICKYCGKSLKAHPKTNGTSRLRRHAKDIHQIELKRRSPKTKKKRLAPTTKATVAQPSAPDKVPSDVIMLEDSGDTDRINSAQEQDGLVQINDVIIKKKALQSLADSKLEDGPARYLAGDIIDAYIIILKDKKKDDKRTHGLVYIETTVGCQPLVYDGACSINTKKIHNYGIKYLKHDMIFLPINQNGNHWYLAVINTKKQEVQVLDSKTQFQERKELKLMLKNIEQYLELASNEIQSNSWPDYKLASWKVKEESHIPKQIDMSSCGLYVIKYMEYWTGEKMGKTFTQADIDLFRLKLAAELMSSPLNKAPWRNPSAPRRRRRGSQS